MIGLVFATHSEAKPFLDLVQAQLVEQKPFNTYGFHLAGQTKRFMAIISGIGKVPAALASQYLISAYNTKHIINAGVCGAATDGITPGQIFCVTESQEGDVWIRNNASVIHSSSHKGFEDLPSARLVTQDKPVCSKEKRARAVKLGELVDMEGAAVAKTCAILDVEVSLVKIVSDLADESTEVDIKQNLPEACAKLAKTLLKGLEKINDGFG